MRVLTVVLAVLWYQSSWACAFSPESLIIGDPVAAMEGAGGVVATLRGQ